MDKAFKTEAMVLTKRNWRENDLLFSFYTKDFGKIEAVVTGARKSTSKLVGPLSSLGVVEIIFVKGKIQNKITHTYLLQTWPVTSLETHYCLSVVREIMTRFVQPDVISKSLWKLFVWFIPSLSSQTDKESQRLLLNIFLIRFLKILGYDFKTDECVQCQKEIEEAKRYSFHHKGFICVNCSGGEMKVSQKVFLTIKKIQEQTYIKEIVLDKISNKELFSFLRKYLQYFLEREVRSLSLI